MIRKETKSRDAYSTTLLRLNAHAWGIAVGLVCGTGLLLATIVLLIKGGEDVGAHLRLLGGLLPGYEVSVGGAFIGFGYAFVIGYAVGRIIGGVYNALTRSA